jgi:aspartyl-tRNA(Asn)/glutamyl-tRNA(Gln) amidotransferase subunit A
MLDVRPNAGGVLYACREKSACTCDTVCEAAGNRHDEPGAQRRAGWEGSRMQDSELAYLSITEAGALFRRHELSPVELANSLIERTRAIEETIVPYVTLTPEIALHQARAAEVEFLKGEATSPLLGIPIAFKDIVMTKGVRTTCGSAVHEDWIPEIDAAVVERWRASGGVMMGKLSTHEFALGLQPPGHMLKPARNPWNPAHVPGGSSSGSGAALAAGLVFGAIGTDTGGSIRNPASYCGISGIKPTYGRVSRYGIVTLAWTLDHAGPMARSVEDLAILLNSLAGYDARDRAAANLPVSDYSASLNQGVSGLRIAVPTNYFLDEISDEQRAALDAAIEVFRGLGAKVDEVVIPNGELAGCTRAVMLPEAYAYHARDLAEVPEKYPEQLRNQFLAGALFLGSEYVQAQRAREILKDAYQQTLSTHDLFLTASQTGDAPSYEEMIALNYRRGPSYTGAFNLTGLPSLSIPCGFSGRGLPLSIMLSGRPFDEATVLRVGHAYQGATDWHTRHPNLAQQHAGAAGVPPANVTTPKGAPGAITISHDEVRRRAGLAGLSIDEARIDEVAKTLEGGLAPLQALDGRAIRRTEPAVRFTAAWPEA